MKIVVFGLTISSSWGKGIPRDLTSKSVLKEEFAEFCAAMIRRYASGAAPAELPAAAAE